MRLLTRTVRGGIFFLILVLINSCFYKNSISEKSIVSIHGLLKVHDAHVVDKNNQHIRLIGNSMYSSNTGWEGEKYYNESVVKWLKKDFSSTIVRVALAVEESGGYITDPEGNVARIKRVIEACIANEIYVIIDFHSFSAQGYTIQAVSFFSEMALLYGKYDNVMYEIYNEPLKVSWSEVVKPYAETVISAIRKIDPDNLIIVGTPNWSQNVVEAANYPINDTNIAYTLHFYAGTHGQWLRDKATEAMRKGIALFVTEWGTCNSSGDGGFNAEASNDWLNYCKINKISLCNWAVNDKDQTVSIIKPGANPMGKWKADEYTQSGTYVREKMRNWNAN
jgi:endoglucanase